MVLGAKFAFAAFIAILVDRVNVRLDLRDFRFGIEPTLAGRDQSLGDMANGSDHISTFFLGEQWVAVAFELSNVGIVANDHIEVAISGDFFEEPNVAGVKPIVTAGDYHLFRA